MRIFYLEPFLIKPERHFIEVTLALNKYLSSQKDCQILIFGHKKLTSDVKSLIPDVIPAISQTCYENIDDQGRSFFKDLQQIHKNYILSREDLVIIPTAFENQILGVARFIQQRDLLCPKIALQFHQLFPPTLQSDDVLDYKFRSYWKNRLKKAFKKIKSPLVSFWTTESKHLNEDFTRLSNRPVGMLPLPYVKFPNEKPLKKRLSSAIKIGFLGEGRQEKGLLFFLDAIKLINTTTSSFEFIIQNMNPRGYSARQITKFNKLLKEIEKYENVAVINNGIPPAEYHQLLLSLDCVVLPYSPVNYKRRISGILIQAASYGIPVIASERTWSEEAIKKGLAVGILFPYNLRSNFETVQNLTHAIIKFQQKKTEIQKNARLCSAFFSHHCRAEKYLDQIISFYEKS